MEKQNLIKNVSYQLENWKETPKKRINRKTKFLQKINSKTKLNQKFLQLVRKLERNTKQTNKKNDQNSKQVPP